MSRDEIELLVDLVASDPNAGEVMEGTGGCRKVRVARPGAGKRGGCRVVTFYTGQNLPVFLITVFGKGEKSNLSKAERNVLAGMTKVLVSEYRSRVVKVGAGR